MPQVVGRIVGSVRRSASTYLSPRYRELSTSAEHVRLGEEPWPGLSCARLKKVEIGPRSVRKYPDGVPEKPLAMVFEGAFGIWSLKKKNLLYIKLAVNLVHIVGYAILYLDILDKTCLDVIFCCRDGFIPCLGFWRGYIMKFTNSQFQSGLCSGKFKAICNGGVVPLDKKNGHQLNSPVVIKSRIHVLWSSSSSSYSSSGNIASRLIFTSEKTRKSSTLREVLGRERSINMLGTSMRRCALAGRASFNGLARNPNTKNLFRTNFLRNQGRSMVSKSKPRKGHTFEVFIEEKYSHLLCSQGLMFETWYELENYNSAFRKVVIPCKTNDTQEYFLIPEHSVSIDNPGIVAVWYFMNMAVVSVSWAAIVSLFFSKDLRRSWNINFRIGDMSPWFHQHFA